MKFEKRKETKAERDFLSVHCAGLGISLLPYLKQGGPAYATGTTWEAKWFWGLCICRLQIGRGEPERIILPAEMGDQQMSA